MAVKTFCSDIIKAFTHCSSVMSIYTYGNLVWPTGPVPPGVWYVRWGGTPSGSFSMWGSTYYYQDYSDIYTWTGVESGIVTERAFDFTSGMLWMETNVLSLSMFAFKGNSNMSMVTLSRCKYVGEEAFNFCDVLMTASLPRCSILSERAFEYCSLLKYISLPRCIEMGSNAFSQCETMSYAYLPSVKTIHQMAFTNCERLRSVYIPEAESVGERAFRSCYSLSSIELPKCSVIYGYAFYSCSSFNMIKMGASMVCTLMGSTTFQGTRITSSTGYIYVPSSLVNAYKTAASWSYFSSRIFPIPS